MNQGTSWSTGIWSGIAGGVIGSTLTALIVRGYLEPKYPPVETTPPIPAPAAASTPHDANTIPARGNGPYYSLTLSSIGFGCYDGPEGQDCALYPGGRLTVNDGSEDTLVECRYQRPDDAQDRFRECPNGKVACNPRIVRSTMESGSKHREDLKRIFKN